MIWEPDENRLMEEEFSHETSEVTGIFAAFAIVGILAIAGILAWIGWNP